MSVYVSVYMSVPVSVFVSVSFSVSVRAQMIQVTPRVPFPALS